MEFFHQKLTLLNNDLGHLGDLWAVSLVLEFVSSPTAWVKVIQKSASLF